MMEQWCIGIVQRSSGRLWAGKAAIRGSTRLREAIHQGLNPEAIGTRRTSSPYHFHQYQGKHVWIVIERECSPDVARCISWLGLAEAAGIRRAKHRATLLAIFTTQRDAIDNVERTGEYRVSNLGPICWPDRTEPPLSWNRPITRERALC